MPIATNPHCTIISGGTILPPSPGFPDDTNTGPVGALMLGNGGGSVSGNNLRFDTDGMLVENWEIRTSLQLYVPANNVTFRNCKIVYTGPLGGTFTMINNQGTNTTFDHCEIDGQLLCERGISQGVDKTIQYCNIHHVGNAIECAAPILVENSYIHDIDRPPGTTWHSDGLQINGGGSQIVDDTRNDNITIRHNTILLPGVETSAINIGGWQGNPCHNVLIENNLMAGGSYTVQCGYGDGSTYVVQNNRLSRMYYPNVGNFNVWYPSSLVGVTRINNVYHETGLSADY